MRILVVEDDTSIAMGIEYSLSQEGYEVKVCTSVAEEKVYIENEKIK